MSQPAYCGQCGEQVSATAKFCKHCGADQAPFATVEAPAPPPPAPPEPEPAAPEPPPVAPATPEPAPVEPPPPPPAPAPPAAEAAGPGVRETAQRLAPGSEEMLAQLGDHLRAPGVAMAGLSALIGLGVSLAVGLILAIVLPNASYLAIGGGSGVAKETMAQAAAFSQANLDAASFESSFRTVPVLFVLIPILAIALGVYVFSPRTVGMPTRQRLLWAAATGIPFGFLMLILALSAGEFSFDLYNTEVELSAGSVFLLSALWGCIGGLAGMAYSLRREGVSLADVVPERWVRPAGILGAALRPLFFGLVVVAVIGTMAWVIQVVREDSYREFPPRSTGVAVVEQLAYAGDHGIDILPLGALADERLLGYPAIPIATEDFFELPSEPAADSASDYNLFDFSDTMPTLIFVPMVIVLLIIPALLALYAGFAIVRGLGEWRWERAAAWGAIVGPVWSLVMVLLAALARKDVVGNPKGDSVFVAFLVGGAVFGALGGLLAAQGGEQDRPAEPPPPS